MADRRRPLTLPPMAGTPPHVGSAADLGAVDDLGRRWFAAVTLGELLGFAIPSTVGGIAWSLDASPIAFYFLLVAAGAGEGAVLGVAQWLVLRNPLPELSRGRWIGATAAAAALAWSLGMLPSTLGDRMESVPLALLAPVVGVGCLALLLSVGAAQAVVLEKHVRGAWLWIAGNALAWCAGLLVSISVISVLVTEDTALAEGIAVGVLAGVLMGATVALVTGRFLVRMLEAR